MSVSQKKTLIYFILYYFLHPALHHAPSCTARLDPPSLREHGRPTSRLFSVLGFPWLSEQRSQSQNPMHECNKTARTCRTLQVEVFGSDGGLRGDLGVNLDSVQVIDVSGDHDVVPVVIIQRLVGVSFNEVSTVPQVCYVVQVAGRRKEGNIFNRCFKHLNLH